MIPLPVASDNDDYLLAGTDTDFEGRIRLMRIDGSGNVVFSKLFWEDNHLKTCFDFTELNGHFYITCLRRASVNISADIDAIEIIDVDPTTGSILDDQVIYDQNLDDGMYPIHTTAYNGFLYICGYVSPNTTHPVQIYNTTEKRGFVLSYDPIANYITHCNYIESSNFSSPPPGTLYDYDMAVRVIPDGANLYITGSGNAIRKRYDNSLSYPLNYITFPSGTMNILLDTAFNNLDLNNSPIAYPFGLSVEGEFGFDMVEKGGYYFNVGNYFSGDTLSYYYNFSVIDPSSLSTVPVAGTGSDSRWSFTGFDYAWGLQTLASQSGGDLLLAGMLVNLPNGCVNDAVKPSFDNFNPFISDITLGFNANTINVTQNFTKTYLSQFGTGSSTLANSYYSSNNWLYNNNWTANFACQRPIISTNNSLGITAPVWWDAPGQLNFKFIQADQIGNVPDCPDSYTDCYLGDGSVHAAAVCTTATVPVNNVIYPGVNATISTTTSCNPYDVNIHPAYSEEDVLDAIEIWDCPANGNLWKEAIKGNIITLSPNPTRDVVTLNLPTNSDYIKVEICDIIGTQTKVLFDGQPNGLSIKLKLPELSSGLYLLKITSEGEQKHILKLNIQ